VSEDSDIAEMGRALKAAKKERHENWKKLNMDALNSSGLQFTVTNCGETILFREDDMPKIDFYPSTGRWRVAGAKKIFRGGANAFLSWHQKLWESIHRENDDPGRL